MHPPHSASAVLPFVLADLLALAGALAPGEVIAEVGTHPCGYAAALAASRESDAPAIGHRALALEEDATVPSIGLAEDGCELVIVSGLPDSLPRLNYFASELARVTRTTQLAYVIVPAGPPAGAAPIISVAKLETLLERNGLHCARRAVLRGQCPDAPPQPLAEVTALVCRKVRPWKPLLA